MTPGGGPLVLGPVAGHRGAAGELTVRVVSGDAARWTGLERVLLLGGPDGEGTSRKVEAARAYRDRLVLKLEGVDDAGAAAALRGTRVAVAARDVPDLPEGRYWLDRLIGLAVIDEDAGPLGRVVDVIETGGGEVLVVAGEGDGESDGGQRQEEILIPLVRRFVRGVDGPDGDGGGRIRVRCPEDLRNLNREA